ncbi:MAG TPA: methyltransferase domain-containing protein [Thermoanaerobaculia bacterium]|nr:methyltransferase domain-containing protein [Thermoanaerobaculia bacterium]
MRRGHLEALRPVCPVCRNAPLAVAIAAREEGDDLREGILVCTGPECLREYPVIDGIPILVSNIRAWTAASLLQVTGRDDLSPEIESLLGDASGPGSSYDTSRQHLSAYAWDHYGDLDPEEDGSPGSVRRLLDRALGLAGEIPDGPVLDVGCSVGRTSFTLAKRLDRTVVGIDLNFGMLRIASRVLREGRVRYDRRRVGMVYDRRDFAADLPGREQTDVWCCDATVLPFADGTFALAASLNVLDCVASPMESLSELARVLAPGGKALLATPYDWSSGATAVEGWLGGHSQRGPHRGASEPVLRALLPLEILAEEPALPWRVRLHDRSAVEYAVHLLVLQSRRA